METDTVANSLQAATVVTMAAKSSVVMEMQYPEFIQKTFLSLKQKLRLSEKAQKRTSTESSDNSTNSTVFTPVMTSEPKPAETISESNNSAIVSPVYQARFNWNRGPKDYSKAEKLSLKNNTFDPLVSRRFASRITNELIDLGKETNSGYGTNNFWANPIRSNSLNNYFKSESHNTPANFKYVPRAARPVIRYKRKVVKGLHKLKGVHVLNSKNTPKMKIYAKRRNFSNVFNQKKTIRKFRRVV